MCCLSSFLIVPTPYEPAILSVWWYVFYFVGLVQVYFSNRSAAYLKLGDAKSKALKDAERCMELAPKWPKSYSRLGAAQHALRRFDVAVQTLKVIFYPLGGQLRYRPAGAWTFLRAAFAGRLLHVDLPRQCCRWSNSGSSAVGS